MFNQGRIVFVFAFFGSIVAACSAPPPEQNAPPADQPATSGGEKQTEPNTEQSPNEPAPNPPKKDPTPDPNAVATCCAGKGTCVPEAAVPADRKDVLTAQECKETNLCVPTENLSPTFKPAACTGGPDKKSKGVCLSKCLKLPFVEYLDEGTCDKDHLCVPCVNPVTNEPTGAPGC